MAGPVKLAPMPLPSVEEMVPDASRVIEIPVEDFSAPKSAHPAPVITTKDLDDIVMESEHLVLGSKVTENPELFFGPIAAALSGQPGASPEGIKTKMLAIYRSVLEACEDVQSGKMQRQFAIDAYIKRLLRQAADKDKESADKADEGRKVRGSVAGMVNEDPVRLSRLKRANEILGEAVRLRDEYRAIEARVGAIRMAAAADAASLPRPRKE